MQNTSFCVLLSVKSCNDMEIALIKESSAASLLLHMPQADTVKHGQTTSSANEVFWTSHFQKQCTMQHRKRTSKGLMVNRIMVLFVTLTLCTR